MPSLIYITRVQSLSAEQAQALEASGVHVKSFGPGEITADECVLVMTSEAALAGLGLSGVGSIKAATGAKDKQSRGTPPLDAIQKHLGADAAIWNILKGASESAAVEAKAVPEQRPSAAVVVPATDSLGFVASQAGVRALAASQVSPTPANGTPGSKNTAVFGLPLPSVRKAVSRQGQAAVFPSKQSHASRESRTQDAESPRRFWQPVAMITALSIFSVILLAGRPSIPSLTNAAAGDSRNPGGGSDPGAAGSIQKGSNVRSSTKASNLAAEGQRHISDYDFVAEDYTTHFELRARPGAATQAPDLRHGAPKRPVRKRVVVD
jgi:hypothetical protein